MSIKNKFIAAILAVISTSFCQLSMSGFAIENVALGDIDGDGSINSSDASMILEEYARISTGHDSAFTSTQLIAGDVDANGTIDSIDASTVLAYYAYVSTGGTLSFEKYLTPNTSEKFDLNNVDTIYSNDENMYFRVDGQDLYAKKKGYYAVVYASKDGYYRTYTWGIEEQYTTLEEAVTGLKENEGLALSDPDISFHYFSDGSTFYVIYSEDGLEVNYALKVIDEEETPPAVTKDIYPRFLVRYNEEETKARNDGTAVYTVRAKIDFDDFESWDDISVPDCDLYTLQSVVCKGDPNAEGAYSEADIEGFDAGTTYDEFNLIFYGNDLYHLSVLDSNYGYCRLDLNVTEVKTTSAEVVDPFENIDTKAPVLSVTIPDTKDVQEGSLVQVKVTSDEPCVMLIGGISYGTIENPVTEAVFEAQYNGRFTVIATDLDNNTAQKSFTVANFVESDESDT